MGSRYRLAVLQRCNINTKYAGARIPAWISTYMSFDTLKEAHNIIPNGHAGVQCTVSSLTGTMNLNCIQTIKGRFGGRQMAGTALIIDQKLNSHFNLHERAATSWRVRCHHQESHINVSVTEVTCRDTGRSVRYN